MKTLFLILGLVVFIALLLFGYLVYLNVDFSYYPEHHDNLNIEAFLGCGNGYIFTGVTYLPDMDAPYPYFINNPISICRNTKLIPILIIKHPNGNFTAEINPYR